MAAGADTDARPERGMSGARRWWSDVTFGSPRPGRRVAALGALGAISGVGETAVVLLLVALVARHNGSLSAIVPSGPTWTLAAWTLAVLAGLAAAHFAIARVTARAATDAQRSLQRLVVNAFLAAPWNVQRAVRPGELQELVMSKARLVVQGTTDAARAVSTAANLLVVVAAAIVVEIRATAALLVVVAFAVLVSRPFQRRTRAITMRMASSSSSLAGDVAETAATTRDLRAFGMLGRARERLAGRIDDSARLTGEMHFSALAVPALTRDATLAVLVLGMAVVVTQASISLTVLGATVVLVLRALGHAQSLSSALQRLADRSTNVATIREHLEHWRLPRQPGTRPCPPLTRLEARHVSVSHSEGAPDALVDVSFVLSRGEQIGIVGATGAGKSTLAAVLLGLLRPRAGDVLVAGVPLEEIDPAQWHARTAWVGQEPHLLSGTVRDNIRFLRPLPDEVVERAAHAAVLGADLARWPDGLDHDVGPMGSALSAGQRQRVTLARALAGAPELVVLDEPTSALDVHAEAAVRQTLLTLRGEAIVVVIAHRLSTVTACDRVAVVRAGRIVALDTPEELAVSDPYFREALELSVATSAQPQAAAP